MGGKGAGQGVYAIVFNEIGSTSVSCRRGISLHATVHRRHLSSRHAYTVLLKYAKRPLYRASGVGSRRRDVYRHGIFGKRYCRLKELEKVHARV
jgi:hypothetical protein